LAVQVTTYRVWGNIVAAPLQTTPLVVVVVMVDVVILVIICIYVQQKCKAVFCVLLLL